MIQTKLDTDCINDTQYNAVNFTVYISDPVDHLQMSRVNCLWYKLYRINYTV